MKNESTTITQRRGNHGDHLAVLQHRQSSRIFMEKDSLCIWWDQLGVLWVAQTERNHYWGSLPNTIDEIELNTQGKTRYYSRHDKIILLHDNAQPHVVASVKTYLETLKWEVLPHPPYFPDIAPSDYHLFWSMMHGLSEQHFTSYEDTKKLYRWLDSLKRWSVLPRYPHTIRKMGKSSG